jgi:hypothetical protein
MSGSSDYRIAPCSRWAVFVGGVNKRIVDTKVKAEEELEWYRDLGGGRSLAYELKQYDDCWATYDGDTALVFYDTQAEAEWALALLRGEPLPAPREFDIRPHGDGFAVYYGEERCGVFPSEEVAKRILDGWRAEMTKARTMRGAAPSWDVSAEAIRTIERDIAAEEERAAMKARLAAVEEQLAASPVARPGWGAAPLPSTLAGSVAAVLRQRYEADLPRKEIERKLKFGEDQFRFPERPDLGTFGLTTLKIALGLARR